MSTLDSLSGAAAPSAAALPLIPSIAGTPPPEDRISPSTSSQEESPIKSSPPSHASPRPALKDRNVEPFDFGLGDKDQFESADELSDPDPFATAAAQPVVPAVAAPAKKDDDNLLDSDVQPLNLGPKQVQDANGDYDPFGMADQLSDSEPVAPAVAQPVAPAVAQAKEDDDAHLRDNPFDSPVPQEENPFEPVVQYAADPFAPTSDSQAIGTVANNPPAYSVEEPVDDEMAVFFAPGTEIALQSPEQALQSQDQTIMFWTLMYGESAVERIITPEIRTRVWTSMEQTQLELHIQRRAHLLQSQQEFVAKMREQFGDEIIDEIVPAGIQAEVLSKDSLRRLFSMAQQQHAAIMEVQGKFIAALKEEFGDEIVDALLPPASRQKVWSEAVKANIFFQLHHLRQEQLELFESTRHLYKPRAFDQVANPILHPGKPGFMYPFSEPAQVLTELRKSALLADVFKRYTAFEEQDRTIARLQAEYGVDAVHEEFAGSYKDFLLEPEWLKQAETHFQTKKRLENEFGVDAVREALRTVYWDRDDKGAGLKRAENYLKLNKIESEIGTAALDGLKGFLRDTGAWTESFDTEAGVDCLLSVCTIPEGFVKMADVGLETLSARGGEEYEIQVQQAIGHGVPAANIRKPWPVRVERNPTLWQRLQASGDLPLKARLQMLGDLVGRMERAKDFWNQLETRYRPDRNSEKEIEAVVGKYFSIYADGTLPSEASLFNKIDMVLERRAIGQQIGRDWEQILSIDSMEAAHRVVPNKELLKKAVTAQMTFERELSRLSKIDGFYRYLYQKVDSEFRLLTIFAEIPEEKRDDFVAKLSKKDQTIIQELQKKATELGQPLSEILQKGIAKRHEVAPQLLDVIQDLEQFHNTEAYGAALKYLDATSPEMRMISAFTRYYIDRNVDAIVQFKVEFTKQYQELEDRIREIAIQIGDGSGASAKDLIEERNRLRALQSPLIPLIDAMTQYMEQPPFKSEVDIHPPLRDYHVLPLGEPLLKDNKGNPQGKWIVVRLSKVGDPAMRAQLATPPASAALLQFLKAEKPLDRKMPNESIWLKYEGGVFALDPEGDIEVCFEDSLDIFQTHDSRDLLQRSRREETAPGFYKRRNKEEIARFKWLKDKKREILHAGWSDDRIATAGPDRLEAMLTARSMARIILSGRLEEFQQADFQSIGEYFDALMSSEVAVLPGSYASGSDPLFLEAWDVLGSMRPELESHYRSRKMLPYLEAGVQEDYKWKKDKTRIMQFTELYESYVAWYGKIREFITEMEKPENQKLAEEHSWIVPALKAILPGLETFIGTLPEELHVVIRKKKEIMDHDSEVQEEWTRRRDLVGTPFASEIEKAKAVVDKMEARFDPKDPVPAKLEEARKNLETARAKYDAAMAPLEQEKKDNDLKRQAEIDGVWQQWRQGKTPEQIDMQIYGTLSQMAGALRILMPSLVMLSIPVSSKKLTDSLTEDLTKKDPALCALYNETAPKAFQNKVKIHDVVLGDVMAGTEPSPLWLQAARTMEIGDDLTAFSEFMRSRQVQERLNQIMVGQV